MKVLFIIDNAPDYREYFLRLLAEKCQLTVVAHPTDSVGLSAPNKRVGYKYLEYPTKSMGMFEVLDKSFNLELSSFDVICVAFNPRHIWRIKLFLKNRSQWKKWVWWGQIYGRSTNFSLKMIRKWLLKKAAAILVYSQQISNKLLNEIKGQLVVSFNNSQTKRNQFIQLDWPETNSLHFIFVGRPQNRKRLDKIVKIAIDFPDTKWRLIGPNMTDFMKTNFGQLPDNIFCYGKTEGDELIRHFKWCHAVINPGHLGLLISNAAKHGRAIIIEKHADHSPEIELAYKANQIFINFDSNKEISELFFNIQNDLSIIKNSAKKLQDVALTYYSVENMVEKHLYVFEQIHK